jgi:ribonucrease Y
MITDALIIITAIVALAAGLAAGLFLLKPKIALSLEEYEKKASAHIAKSEEEAKKIKEEIAGRIKNLKEKSINEEEMRKEQFKRIENLIISKEEHLSRKQQRLEDVKKVLDEEVKFVESLKQKSRDIQGSFTQKLAQKSGQAIGEAKTDVMHELERDLDLEREDRLRKYEDYIEEEKERIAKNIITDAIQRYSGATSVEKRADVLIVPHDDVKGRLVGKNAENLKLLEELTGADIIFNDAPNSIIIACFDLIKKHVAKETVSKLMREKIITGDKIRQAIKDAENETGKTLVRLGRDLILKMGLEKRNLPEEFAKIVGRLQFRTSYGQNIAKHSYEVGAFTVMLGNELGLNLETCKIGGFFHDIGKAVDQEVGGSHDVLTKEILEKYGFSEEEIHAAWTHHDAMPQRTPEAMLVKAGDAISAGRPGARAESLDKYLERIRALESISSAYEGVSKSFAISAGREVRVIVEPQKLKDEDLVDLAKNIAGDIQENLTYPGKIKINVIRRTQNVDYANKIPGPTKQVKKS